MGESSVYARRGAARLASGTSLWPFPAIETIDTKDKSLARRRVSQLKPKTQPCSAPHSPHANSNRPKSRPRRELLLLVCRETGRQHRLEIPHPDRPHDFALESMPRLLIDVPRLADTMMMMPDDDWSARRTVSTRDLDALACDCCAKLGTLIDTFELGMRCPNCHDVLPRPIAEWMT